MTKPEFVAVMAFLEAGINKPLSKASCEVYWDLLGDLPLDVLQTAARRVMTEHVWSTFPSIAELRQAAVETMSGQTNKITSAEAWQMGWAAIAKIDPDIPGSVDKHLADIDPLVREAVIAFGIPALCYGKEPISVVRSQFCKFFEQLQDRSQRLKLFPAKVQESIESIGKQQAVEKIAGKIGVLP